MSEFLYTNRLCQSLEIIKIGLGLCGKAHSA